MREKEEPLARKRHLTELFAELKSVVADNPRIQEMIRSQEQDNRQVLLNMSSVLRMVEQEQVAPGDGPVQTYEPKVVSGWVMGDNVTQGDTPPESEEPQAQPPAQPTGRVNFFDRAFLKSLKISA